MAQKAKTAPVTVKALAASDALTYSPIRAFVYIVFLAHLLIGFFLPSHWLSVFNDVINAIQWFALIWLIELLRAQSAIDHGKSFCPGDE